RVQVTQDVLPADITGHFFFNRKISEFEFRQGPIFSNVILADEINRASAKTQSALLEAMQEGQVTVEGRTYKLPQPFFVIATQNPIDVEGVYTLPVAQLDRFMLKTNVSYLPRSGERQVLERALEDQLIQDPKPAADTHTAQALRDAHKRVHVDQSLLDYVLDLVEATRGHEDLQLGASTRASLHLLHASQARALLDDRDYVIPDDVKRVAPDVLAHRLAVTVDAELEERQPVDIVAQLLDDVTVPQVPREAR
ncbi:MAG: MoxR family ATPase, partial [Candidatus Thermoplasmatota archaeon]|nr:MoxR family ATPase [Candidatus Thermoplasmatota archaeon]